LLEGKSVTRTLRNQRQRKEQETAGKLNRTTERNPSIEKELVLRKSVETRRRHGKGNLLKKENISDRRVDDRRVNT
jgi:hypothetical protein